MRQILATLLGLVLLSGHISTIAAQKVTKTPASFTFADRTVGTYGVQDRITSDGVGAYTDGTDGVTGVLFSSTGDARLDATYSRNPLRVIEYEPSQLVTGTGPTASFASTGAVDIQALGQMHVGDFKLTGAAFGNEGGTYVTATRLDAHTWTITTDDPHSLGAGDVAVLVQTVKNKTSKTGTYHLPFQLTVTCPTCVAPL
jgi:hypothetical protein